MWISSFLSLPEIIQWKDNNNSIIIFNAAKSRSVYFSLVKRYFLGFAFILCSIEWSNGWFVFDNVYIIGCWLDYIYIYIYISKNKNNILIMVDAHTKKGQTDSISCFPSWLLWLALFSLYKSNQFNHWSTLLCFDSAFIVVAIGD